VVFRNPTLLRVIHSHHPPHLSALNAPLVHTRHSTVAVREQVRRWFSISRSTWSRALGRGTYGGCVVGEDGQGLLRTLHRHVRRLLARRAACKALMGLGDTPLHTATRRPQHDGGTPWSEPAALRVGLLRGGGCASCPQLCQNPTRLLLVKHSTGGSYSSATTRLPIHSYPPIRLADFLSEAHTSGETQHVSVRHPPWCLLMLLAVRQGTSQQ
jgi:hypothetical protein